MEAIFSFLKSIIESSGMQNELVVQILMIIGMMRVVFKPLMSLVQAIVSITPSLSDDSFLAKMMENKIYKIIAYFLDWAASIKLPQKK